MLIRHSRNAAQWHTSPSKPGRAALHINSTTLAHQGSSHTPLPNQIIFRVYFELIFSSRLISSWPATVDPLATAEVRVPATAALAAPARTAA